MTDERYKKIMQDMGMPESHSLLAALKQVANEVAQEKENDFFNRLMPIRDRAVAIANNTNFTPNEMHDEAEMIIRDLGL